MKEPHNFKCLQCKRIVPISYDYEDFKKWKQGTLIQNAMPYLSLDEREIMISGICGTCYDKMFKEDDQ